MSFASHEMAKDMASTWSNAPNSDPGFRARQRILNRLADYFKAEYDRRIRRHAFYEDLGFGGKTIVEASRFVAEQIGKPPPVREAAPPPQPPRTRPAPRGA